MESQITYQIAKHIREFYFGKNWTWSYLKENLSDVTWKEATTKIGSVNTIVGLTYHIHYYVASIVSVLEGGPLVGMDKYSFDHPEITSQESWEAFLEHIYGEVEHLAQLVEQLEEHKLWETYVEDKYGNYFRNIQGFTEHCHYHLGQIVILKKLIRDQG